MAGLAFAICNKSQLLQLEKMPKCSFYLSLYDQYDYMNKTGQMRFTPPVQSVYALRKAIDEYFEEGIMGRYNRYTNNWQRLKAGLKELGFKFLLRPENESHILMTIVEPKNKYYNFDTLHDLLYKHSFTIYPGKIGSENTFRLSIMGAIDETDIILFINKLKEALITMKVVDSNTGKLYLESVV